VRPAPSVFAVLLALQFLLAGEGLPGAASDLDPGIAPGDLASLMDLFAASGGVRANFEETRYLAILMEPIETAGVLYFAPPDRLARHTIRPGHSRIVVRGDRVSFSDETGSRVVDLRSSEVARSLVDNLRILLRGDLLALRKRYDARYETDGGSWMLDLKPRSRHLRAVIERIRVTGRGPVLQSLETRETSGDRSVILLSRVETHLDFEPAELEWIFSLGPTEETP
jgi:outer membrane lipoprotein-sorting protein